MERNRPVAAFGILIIALMWIAAVVASAAVSPEHRVRNGVIALVVFPALLLLVLGAIAGLNVLVFSPLLSLLARLGQNTNGDATRRRRPDKPDASRKLSFFM
jgi:hypothetical protein